MGTKTTAAFSFVVALLVASAAFGEARTFTFSPGGLSQAVFHSEAPLESMTGTSNAVAGEVTVDLSAPGTGSGTLSIDTASFRTGIEMRDEHLAGENWLNAAAFPQITFEVTSVSVPDGSTLENAAPVSATVVGNLSLHGVTKEVTAEGEVAFYVIDEETRASGGMTGLVGDALRIEVGFSVSLTDYGIAIPPVLATKVADQIDLTLRLTGIDQNNS